jgi:LmbE family N-acetylglucosaminyl deacetylase
MVISLNGQASAGLEPALTELRDRLEALRPSLSASPFVTLVIVVHNDDEALGPGATLAELARQPGLVLVALLAADNPTRRAETMRTVEILGIPSEHVFQFDFPDGDLVNHFASIRRLLRIFAERVNPDLVITHKADDHPDHSVAYTLTRQVFGRGGTSLLYFRIPQPTYSPWHPTVFIRVSEESAQLKLDKLLAAYPTESWKDYFDPVRHAGILAEAGHNAGSRYAEPFETTQVNLTVCHEVRGSIVLARNPARYSEPSDREGDDQRDRTASSPGFETGRVVLGPSSNGSSPLVLAGIRRPSRVAE